MYNDIVADRFAANPPVLRGILGLLPVPKPWPKVYGISFFCPPQHCTCVVVTTLAVLQHIGFITDPFDYAALRYALQKSV